MSKLLCRILIQWRDDRGKKTPSEFVKSTRGANHRKWDLKLPNLVQNPRDRIIWIIWTHFPENFSQASKWVTNF